MVEFAKENDQRQEELNKANVLKLKLVPLTADPGTLEDGDVWHRGDTDTVHIQLNGVKKTFTVT